MTRIIRTAVTSVPFASRTRASLFHLEDPGRQDAGDRRQQRTVRELADEDSEMMARYYRGDNDRIAAGVHHCWPDAIVYCLKIRYAKENKKSLYRVSIVIDHGKELQIYKPKAL